MRFDAQVALNAAVFLALFVAGAVVHSAVDAPIWCIPLSMVPCLLWFWWRAPGERLDVRLLIALVVLATAASYVRRMWLPADSSWDAAETLAIVFGLMWLQSRNSHGSRQPRETQL